MADEEKAVVLAVAHPRLRENWKRLGRYRV